MVGTGPRATTDPRTGKTVEAAYANLDDAPEQRPPPRRQSEPWPAVRYFAGAAGVSNVENISCKMIRAV